MSEEPKTRENLGPPDDDPTASTLPGELPGVLGAPVSISVAQQIVSERYRLEHVSGSGSMGRVFVATDTTLQRRVATRLLPHPRAPPGPGAGSPGPMPPSSASPGRLPRRASEPGRRSHGRSSRR